MRRALIARVTMIAVLFCGLLGCNPRAPRANQKQSTTSPNGKYVLTVPIEAQTTNPEHRGTRVWKVTIADTSGAVLYKDEQSTMLGNLNVYWGWDDQNRVWLYNSDDGAIWRWELTPEGWKKIPSQETDGIPEWVLPDYIKGR